MSDVLKKGVLFIFSILLLAFFEAGQQYYYVKSFDILPSGQTIDFIDILNVQSLWWLFWSVTSSFFIYYLFKNPILEYNANSLIKLGLCIIGFFMLTVILFGLTQQLIQEDPGSLTSLLIFKIFQKAPISMIAYILCILFANNYHQAKEVEVLVKNIGELSVEVKFLKENKSDSPKKVLSAKIGNTRQVIPLNEINYIQADDYCVNVFTVSKKKFVIRTTLKNLEIQLPSNFVRVHRKYLINLQFVDQFKMSEFPRLVMKNEKEVEVAKNRVKQLQGVLTC